MSKSIPIRVYLATLAVLQAMQLQGCSSERGIDRAEVIASVPGEAIEVSAGFGPNHATIYSEITSEGGEKIPHGLQVTTEHGWLREAAVYDHGLLIRHYYLHHNGYSFIATHRDAAGDGSVLIWNNRGSVVYSGIVRGGKRWTGHFMVKEFIPNTYGEQRIMLYEYRDGERVGREQFPFDRVDVAPPDHSVDPSNWPWAGLDWPAPAAFTGDEESE